MANELDDGTVGAMFGLKAKATAPKTDLIVYLNATPSKKTHYTVLVNRRFAVWEGDVLAGQNIAVFADPKIPTTYGKQSNADTGQGVWGQPKLTTPPWLRIVVDGVDQKLDKPVPLLPEMEVQVLAETPENQHPPMSPYAKGGQTVPRLPPQLHGVDDASVDDGTVGAAFRSFQPRQPPSGQPRIPQGANFSMAAYINKYVVVETKSNLTKDQALQYAQSLVNYFKAAEGAGPNHGAEVSVADGSKVLLLPGMHVSVIALEAKWLSPTNTEYSKIFAWEDVLWANPSPYGVNWQKAKSILAGVDALEVHFEQADGTLGAVRMPYKAQQLRVPQPPTPMQPTAPAPGGPHEAEHTFRILTCRYSMGAPNTPPGQPTKPGEWQKIPTYYYPSQVVCKQAHLAFKAALTQAQQKLAAMLPPMKTANEVIYYALERLDNGKWITVATNPIDYIAQYMLPESIS